MFEGGVSAKLRVKVVTEGGVSAKLCVKVVTEVATGNETLLRS
jgi:hypothetical protein